MRSENHSENTSSNDPWVPQTSHVDAAGHQDEFTSSNFIPCPQMRIKTSEEHIANLEAKLNKMKGKSMPGELSSRDLLKSLSQVRRDSANHYPTTNSEAFIEQEIEEEDSPFAQLQRRLYPERQALNTDELLHLVENDLLQKVTTELNEQQCTSDKCSD